MSSKKSTWEEAKYGGKLAADDWEKSGWRRRWSKRRQRGEGADIEWGEMECAG